MSNVIKILIPPGVHVIIDESDLHVFGDYIWHAQKPTKTCKHFYVRANTRQNGKHKIIKLHRILMGVSDPNIKVDHKNGNTLDNRRENLRNCRNQKVKPNKYKGVFVDQRMKSGTRMYYAKICLDRKTIHLGFFYTEKEAAIAYNKAAILYHGEFARLNVIV